MPEELDGIEIPIGADLSDLQAGIETATKELNKLQKERERDAVQGRKKARSEERKALANKLRDFRKVQGQLTAEQKKSQMSQLASFRKFESEKINIARSTAKKIGKVQLAEQKKVFAEARKQLGKQKIGEGVIQAGAGALALGGIASGFDSAIEKTKEFETALTGLRAVAKANQETVGASLDDVSKKARELAKDGTLSINDAAQSLKLLISQGKSLDRAFKLTSAVKQISALENISGDAGQATQDLFKGLITNSADLIENASPSLRGIAKDFGGITAVVEDTTKQQEFFNAVIAKGEGLNKSYEQSLDTIAGRQKQFNQTLDEFQVSIGETVAPIFAEIQGAIASVIASFTEWFNGLSQSSKQILVLGSALAVAVPALVAFAGGILKVIAGLKALGIASSVLAAGPLAAIIAAVSLLTLGVVALNEAISDSPTDKSVDEFNSLSNALENAEGSTEKLSAAQSKYNGFLQNQTPLIRAALQATSDLNVSLEDQKRLLNEISSINQSGSLEDQIEALEDLLIEEKERLNKFRSLGFGGRGQRFRSKFEKEEGVEDQERVVAGLKKSIADLNLQLKKQGGTAKTNTKIFRRNTKEFQDQKTLLQDTEFIEDQLFLNRRALNDQIRAASKNIEMTLGLQRGVNESVEKYNENIDKAFTRLSSELNIQKKRNQTTDDYRKQLVDILASQEKTEKALANGKKITEAITNQAKMLRKEFGGASREALELSKTLSKTQQILNDNILPALGGVNDTISGIKDGDLGGIVEGVGLATSAVNQQVGQIIQGVGQAIGLLGEIFDIQSAEERLAQRRAKLAKELQKTEEDTIALLKIKESINRSILELAQKQKEIALDELAIREQINQTFGEGTVEEREQDLADKQQTLDEITKGTAAEDFDFETREGQLAGLDKKVELEEQLAVAEQARQIIDDLPNLSNIKTEQLVEISRRLNSLASDAGPQAESQIKSFTGTISKIINSRATRRKLTDRISDLKRKLENVVGKSGDAQKRRRELSREINQLESVRRGELDRFNERKSEFRQQQETSAGLGGTIGGLGASVTAIDQAIGLGQETVELEAGIRQQRGEERVAFLQDLVADATRSQEAAPENQAQIQSDLTNNLVEEITPKLAESNKTIEELIDIVTSKVNSKEEGFRKQELEILLEQLKTQQDISLTSAASAANLDNLTKDRNRGIIDISRGLIRDIGGSFALQDQGVNFGVPEAVSNLSQTLGSVDNSQKSIPEQQLEVLKMIEQSTNRMADFFENAPTSINPNEAEKFLLDMLASIQFSKVS